MRFQSSVFPPNVPQNMQVCRQTSSPPSPSRRSAMHERVEIQNFNCSDAYCSESFLFKLWIVCHVWVICRSWFLFNSYFFTVLQLDLAWTYPTDPGGKSTGMNSHILSWEASCSSYLVFLCEEDTGCENICTYYLLLCLNMCIEFRYLNTFTSPISLYANYINIHFVYHIHKSLKTLFH